MLNTQIAIIGGGPGGYVAAFKAADAGLDVTLIDPEENPGGVCLYRGCIPSKALLHIAKLINETRQASQWGIQFGTPEIDLDQLRAHKNNVIEKMTGGLGQLVKARKLKHIQASAQFKDAHNLDLTLIDGNKESLTFDYAILSTGSSPAIPGIFDNNDSRIMDSTSALELQEVPKSMLIVGGGIIGMELGQVYAALGSSISVVEMMPGLIPPADRDLVKPLRGHLESQFENIWTSTKVTGVTPTAEGISVEFDAPNDHVFTQTFSRVLVSVGRFPNSSGLGIESTDVQIDDRGFIRVDSQMRTAESSIFAIGDVIGAGLAHTASHQGTLVAEILSGHEKLVFEPRAIPNVVYTDPEIAWCGLTEQQAKDQGIDCKIARFPWSASGRATAVGRNEGLTKLLIDPSNDRVLGVGISGNNAGELIAEGVVAVEMAALASDIQLSIHPHPTLSETFMEAAEVYYGQSPHLYTPRPN
ncbi:MAG: dihydrolipoyl dehydrogenase [Candidatus Latescibacterota bacterium]|nr:dihydrolipoyl dehydrogenase [Candidatus Latescibacterota bacterium]